MIDLEETERGIRAVDAAKNEVEITLEGWVPGGEEMEIDRNVDVVISGHATKVEIPGSGVLIESSELLNRKSLHYGESIQLPSGRHLFKTSSPISVYLHCNGRVAVQTQPRSMKIVIENYDAGVVSLGLKSEQKLPKKTIFIPGTVAGLANAINIFGRTPHTESPDRSYPNRRPHPPLIELDDSTCLDVCSITNDGDIRFKVPCDLEVLFTIAPLAYYLGAEVVVEKSASPQIMMGSFCHVLSKGLNVHSEVSELLHRMFFMDCIVREAGPNAMGIREIELLNQSILDPQVVYELPMSERFIEYLSYPFESMIEKLPRWPIGVYTKPNPSRIQMLPYLLDRMALIHPPESVSLDGPQMVERSIHSFHRSGTDKSCNTRQPVEVIGPKSHGGTVKGWNSEGIAINAFNCSTEAFDNGYRNLLKSSKSTLITVIIADSSMSMESSTVLDTYRQRASTIDIQVELLHEVTCEGLADIFEGERDFIHFVGHSDPEGIHCSDGVLSPSQLSISQVPIFFLNACGSSEFGDELIRKGSAAGVVTVGKVLDRQAMTVGSAFAQLMMLGYTVERSLFLARNQVLMSQQYAVLGDGTQILSQNDTIQPMTLYITPAEDGTYRVHFESVPIHLNGGVYRSFSESSLRLLGNNTESEMTSSELFELLKSTNNPVIMDGKIHWPNELLDSLFR